MLKVKEVKVLGGFARRINFENGFTLSVVEHKNSYGLEAALMKDGKVVYDRGTFQDVVPYLDVPQLLDLIAEVANLSSDYQTSEEMYFDDDYDTDDDDLLECTDEPINFDDVEL